VAEKERMQAGHAARVNLVSQRSQYAYRKVKALPSKIFWMPTSAKEQASDHEATNVDEFFTPIISDQPIRLPLFSTKVAAGFPSPADDHVEKSLDISEFLIDHAASTFFVTIKGDSMIDVGLLPGDKVVVDRSKTPGIGDIVLAVVDREFTIKILDHGANKMPRLMPANSTGTYRPIYIRPDTQFEIFGVVTGSFRRFK
jgi:DNA polymerase V